MTKMQNRIFSVDSPKAIKARAYGYLNAIHYLAPADLAGVGDLCPFRSIGCTKACLGWESGQAAMVSADHLMNSIRLSRIAKAKRFMSDRKAYLHDMWVSISKLVSLAIKLGLKLCVRLNGSSDISWESIKYDGFTMMEWFPEVQFVDYTKNPNRALRHAAGLLPRNYHLTFSRHEHNRLDCISILQACGTVAVVFENKPETWEGFPCVDGDKHDLIHTVPKGHVIALSPKGRKAKADTSGFVVR